jgi:serine/threonine-protein kinase
MQIGSYEVLHELGRGGMGVVYQAFDPLLQRTVAIKTIRFTDALRDRLLREARSAAILSHPNIVTIYQMTGEESSAYIVMEYVHGPTLEQWLTSGTPPSAIRCSTSSGKRQPVWIMLMRKASSIGM